MLNRHRHTSQRQSYWLWKLVLALLFIGVVANVATAVIYHGRELPHTYLGVLNVSGRTFSSLSSIPASTVLPATFTLRHDTTTAAWTPSALGLQANVAASLHAANFIRQWIPLTSFVVRENLPLQLHLRSDTYAKATASLAKTFTKAPLAKHVVFTGTSFTSASPSNGYHLNTPALPMALFIAARHADPTVIVPIAVTTTSAGSNDISSDVQTLQKELSTTLTFTYQNRTIRPAKSDIGAWYKPDGQTMSPSTDLIAAYLTNSARQLGITLANPNDIATGAVYSLTKNFNHTLTLTPQAPTTVVRTYCTAVSDVDSSVLTDLTGKLAATYNDSRGWNDNGRIAFEHVDSGCQYTVWMSASSQMTSFGAICDNYYNCQVGTNVILNNDRWASGTPPWNATHGSLEDYRTLMIDHETGHRLGFLDNPTCPGQSQPAPVMMQQSINLKGCTFNIWPLQSEFAQLNSSLGITAAIPAAAASE